MNVRQRFNLEAARFVPNEDPIPFGPFACSLFDQFLIDQPRFDRAKVANARLRNLFDFLRNCDLTVGED